MSIRDLQQALPNWVRLERKPEDPEVEVRPGQGVVVVEVNAYPEAPPDSVRADVHFVLVAPTEGFPETEVLVETVRGALGDGVFQHMGADDLAGGPSYIRLGGWLGSQDLALMLIGAVELADIAKAVTPKVLGMTGETARQMAGAGMVMLGPSKVWGVDDGLPAD